jgi:hypothetical protein
MKIIRIKNVFAQIGSPYVEGSEIQKSYGLSDMAVKYVREAQPQSLYNIIKIKNLPVEGAFGKFKPSETKYHVPKNVIDELANYVGFQFTEDQFSQVLNMIKGDPKYSDFKDFNVSQVSPEHVIWISIDEITSSVERGVDDVLDFHFNVIKQIAETIIHESKHGEQDLREKSTFRNVSEMSEPEAYGAEISVTNFFNSNKNRIYNEINDRLFKEGIITSENYQNYKQTISNMR